MRLASWNVNGIRSVASKGFHDWARSLEPDVICLQEIKAHPEQLDPLLANPEGYHTYWMPALKKGYSGVAALCRREPLSVERGMGIPEFDNEGRTLTLEFKDFFLVNTYFPNSQRDHGRLGYKLKFCKAIHEYLQAKMETGKDVVICGDFNIAHREIDLKNPKQNMNNAGFLPQEREWMEKFLAKDFVDTFRRLHPEPERYTWWSYRPTIRERNIGWRLDYFVTNADFFRRVKASDHQEKVAGSDHCPILLEVR